MNLAFSLLDWQAAAPGLPDAAAWRQWAAGPPVTDPSQPLPLCRELPMMTARRLNDGSRLAVECGLALLRRQGADAVVFTSRHGELARNLRILQALAGGTGPSPTDFAMSVHNAAIGSLTIAAAQPLVSASLAAGADTFLQGLSEVAALQAAGYARVLLVDFDGTVPAFYRPHIAGQMPTSAYAVGLLLAPGDALCGELCWSGRGAEPSLPQSLQFLHAIAGGHSHFRVSGSDLDGQWTHRHG
ncbi:beta-ketoacyl synthase [Chimaeribacter californicus]|uniref:Beta-ketoacyl synthase n=1 Tax=Chimaeribacter californicus TaxID=2060067 RepID=A0A2N5E780_9GAMM|nr:beta-ketoacyl synthase chain length factor [Chimaeribacter californicus]PLR37338.1 beta-ketoacyl synthase [Chimaeribacter californicus]